jgi:ankyrin repeat protein
MLPPVQFSGPKFGQEDEPQLKDFRKLPMELRNQIVRDPMGGSLKGLVEDVFSKQKDISSSALTLLTRDTLPTKEESNAFLQRSLQTGRSTLFNHRLQTTDHSQQLDLPPLINIAALKGDQAAFEKLVSRVNSPLPRNTFQYVADCGQPAMLKKLWQKGPYHLTTGVEGASTIKDLINHATQQQEEIRRLQKELSSDEKNRKLFEVGRSATPNTPQIIALVRAGADVKAKDQFGYTPLHWAARRGHTELAQTLLDAGADAKAENDMGETPLHEAACEGHTEFAQTLLNAGADAKAENDMGYTPLHEAACEGHTELVQTLLNAGANANAKDEDGSTPLHEAAMGGHTALAQTLLNAGANANAKDEDGSTPLHEAAMGGHTALAQTLLNAGAEVDAKDNAGKTPLHWAASKGRTALAQTLLNAGADVNAKDQFGSTALYSALLCNHNATVDLLRQRGAADQVGVAFPPAPAPIAGAG